MKQVTNLNERSQYFASNDLLNELRGKIKDGDILVNFAFTDYGGDFFDKVMIQYFSEYHPESIVKENTVYSGENAFIFGQVAAEFLEAYERYPLGYEDTESFYSEKERETEEADFARFLEDITKYSGYVATPEALEYLLEHKGGYYGITTQGLDYSESELINFCLEAGIISKETEPA